MKFTRAKHANVTMGAAIRFATSGAGISLSPLILAALASRVVIQLFGSGDTGTLVVCRAGQFPYYINSMRTPTTRGLVSQIKDSHKSNASDYKASPIRRAIQHPITTRQKLPVKTGRNLFFATLPSWFQSRPVCLSRQTFFRCLTFIGPKQFS